MLTIPREVPVKVGKHAWNVFPLEAFGYLLGSKADSTVYAALPCAKTQRRDEFEDRWAGIADNIEKARAVGRLFDMEVVGFYASTDFDNGEEFPSPPLVESGSMGLFLLYRMICCPQCSMALFKQGGRTLKRDADYVVPRGARANNSISQKRILKEWNAVYGAVKE
jgi:hypothetical protein